MASLPAHGVAGNVKFIDGLSVDLRKQYAQGKIVTMDSTEKYESSVIGVFYGGLIEVDRKVGIFENGSTASRTTTGHKSFT